MKTEKDKILERMPEVILTKSMMNGKMQDLYMKMRNESDFFEDPTISGRTKKEVWYDKERLFMGYVDVNGKRHGSIVPKEEDEKKGWTFDKAIEWIIEGSLNADFWRENAFDKNNVPIHIGDDVLDKIHGKTRVIKDIKYMDHGELFVLFKDDNINLAISSKNVIKL